MTVGMITNHQRTRKGRMPETKARVGDMCPSSVLSLSTGTAMLIWMSVDVRNTGVEPDILSCRSCEEDHDNDFELTEPLTK